MEQVLTGDMAMCVGHSVIHVTWFKGAFNGHIKWGASDALHDQGKLVGKVGCPDFVSPGCNASSEAVLN